MSKHITDKIPSNHKEGMAKLELVAKQTRQLIQTGKVSCECGVTKPPYGAIFKCYYCGIFVCQKCAEKHFGEKRVGMLDGTLNDASA